MYSLTHDKHLRDKTSSMRGGGDIGEMEYTVEHIQLNLATAAVNAFLTLLGY
jgi:hypothetical protein